MAGESSNQSTEPASSDTDVLSTYEEMFKHRYTDADPDYVKTSEASSAPPPCVENWYSRPKRSFNWTQRPDNRNRDHSRHGNEGHGNRDQRGYNDYGRNRDHSREHYQSKDRHAGHDNRGDNSSEHQNKYYRREDHGRGYRH